MQRSTILSAIVSACALAMLSTPATAALPKAALTEGYDELATFSQRLDMTCSGNYASSTIAVPAGERLVVDYVSADVEVLPIGAIPLFDVATINNNAEVEAHLPMQLLGTIFGQSNYALSAPMKVLRRSPQHGDDRYPDDGHQLQRHHRRLRPLRPVALNVARTPRPPRSNGPTPLGRAWTRRHAPPHAALRVARLMAGRAPAVRRADVQRSKGGLQCNVPSSVAPRHSPQSSPPASLPLPPPPRRCPKPRSPPATTTSRRSRSAWTSP